MADFQAGFTPYLVAAYEVRSVPFGTVLAPGVCHTAVNRAV